MNKRLGDEIKKRKPFDAPEQEAVLNVLRTADLFEGQLERLFREHGLSSPQYNVLRILRGAGQPLPCQEIGSRMISRLPDVTRLVDRLEQAGNAERARIREDRRVVLVSITEAGLALLAKLDRPLLDLHRSQLGHMRRAELAQLNDLLCRARQAE